jgi:YegS/Rv2252/BmrU family lipid kinase
MKGEEMKRTKIILNPIAGRGRGARVEPELRSLLKSEGIDFDLVRTAGPWHAVELAERAVSDGFEPIVAAGGDGTMHEVVNGLMATSDAGETGTLGIIPIGSGSDFAHTVGVPPNLRAACQRLAHGQERVVDVGQITMPGQETRYFDNTLGIGFDAVVTVEALKVKWLRGMALYLPVVLKTVFLSLKVPRATIEYDGQALTLPALMICVANGPREGGGFFVAPQAQPDDGLFDLCITREVSRLAQLGLIPHFIKGTHLDLEPVTMARARRVTISSPDDLVAHVDGEVLCTDGHQIECEILPRRLRVRC